MMLHSRLLASMKLTFVKFIKNIAQINEIMNFAKLEMMYCGVNVQKLIVKKSLHERQTTEMLIAKIIARIIFEIFLCILMYLHKNRLINVDIVYESHPF